MGRIVTGLDRLAPHDVGLAERIYDSLQALLDTYHDHSQKEMQLVQDVLLRDMGGEG